ncbi:hypothetical protein GCM10020367_10580 [Streptomyces sannanensis]|uniref:Uncharacterized protein n=1 Tax=Streptomyces sannanensis TaxID=285536 RepID=A0ABP6S6G8_9ACTN
MRATLTIARCEGDGYIWSEVLSGRSGRISERPPQSGWCPGGAVHRKAEEGVHAVGAPPSGSWGTSATDDNAARCGAGRREPGMTGRTGPRREPRSEGPHRRRS